MRDKKTLEERFWPKVKKGPGCWLWTASVDKAGYGQIQYSFENGRMQRASAHRVSYELNIGPIPDGLVVRHKCDVPRCVRPSHLEVGTYAQNTEDMIKRGRRGKVLPAEAVKDIRAARLDGVTPEQLANRYGVHLATIYAILSGNSRRDVEFVNEDYEAQRKVRKETHCKNDHERAIYGRKTKSGAWACRECMKSYRAKWNQGNPEQLKAIVKANNDRQYAKIKAKRTVTA